MSNYSSAKYYQDNKGSFKKSRGKFQNLSKEEKQKTRRMKRRSI